MTPSRGLFKTTPLKIYVRICILLGVAQLIATLPACGMMSPYPAFKTSGEWRGIITTINLYDQEGNAYKARVLEIEQGTEITFPIAAEYSRQAVLTTSGDKLCQLPDYGEGMRVRILGQATPQSVFVAPSGKASTGLSRSPNEPIRHQLSITVHRISRLP